MLASVISAIVFLAIFSAYIFMARNLTRLANFQQQQVQDRRAFYVVSKDVNDATNVTSATSTSLSLTLSSGASIDYTYTPPIPGPPLIPGTLTRRVNGVMPAPILLSNLTSFTFNYFNQTGVGPASMINTKQIEMVYSSAVGDGANGTRAPDNVVSSRMVMRGRPAFGQ